VQVGARNPELLGDALLVSIMATQRFQNEIGLDPTQALAKRRSGACFGHRSGKAVRLRSKRLRGDYIVIGEDEGPFYRMPELAYIPRPALFHEPRQSGLGDLGCRPAMAYRKVGDEMRDKCRDVVEAPFQRRDLDRDRGNPV